jgi:hypothetical protein
MQEACFSMTQSANCFAVSAPTGSGKTVLFELAMCSTLVACGAVDATGVFLRPRGSCKLIYMVRSEKRIAPLSRPLTSFARSRPQAPMKAIVAERQADWQRRFGRLGLAVVSLTGDGEPSEASLREADLILSTPEKLDGMTRRAKGRSSWTADTALLMIDEARFALGTRIPLRSLTRCCSGAPAAGGWPRPLAGGCRVAPQARGALAAACGQPSGVAAPVRGERNHPKRQRRGGLAGRASLLRARVWRRLPQH